MSPDPDPKLFGFRLTPGPDMKKYEKQDADSDLKQVGADAQHCLLKGTVSTDILDFDQCLLQCCGSRSGSERIRTFMRDPDPNNWFGSGAERIRIKTLCSKT